MNKTLLFLIVLLFQLAGFAQNTSGKIIDATTGESIPYANISISGAEHLITNEEGVFTLSDKHSDNSQFAVSYLGYVSQQLSIGELKKQQNTIKLQPGVFELSDVDVSKVKMDANSIMAEVKKNLKNNYGSDDTPIKTTLFMREMGSFKPKKLDVEITKSTGFTKSKLKEANDDVTKFTSRLMSNPPLEFTDMLCKYYTGKIDGKDKPVFMTKLDVVKATKLKDETRSVDIEDMEKLAANIFLKHLDTTKYYRIKSGWFGSKDTLSFRKDFNKKKKKKEKRSEVDVAKSDIVGFLSENNVLYGERMDFANNIEIYEYKYEGAMYSNKNEFVYVLSFKPKKSKAKFTGKLYVSENDFAVVRAEYNLAKGKTLGGVNLKLLLGVKASNNVARGTVTYKQNQEGLYHVQYASVETGQYIYLNRPLKFIELTDEDKDVVALDLKVEGNSYKKVEFLNIAQEEIASGDLEKMKEEDFQFTRLKRYDPKIWKDYTAIEPLEEMKQFKVVEE